MVLPARANLSATDAESVLSAIEEFKNSGRAKFLKKYGFSRSSKFYLLYEERLYDTKVLVAAAYFHATGRKLAHDRFAGGTQTTAVLQKIKKHDIRFKNCHIFEDNLGELSTLSGEFDRLPRGQSNLRSLGFSKWIPLGELKKLHTRTLPGVYVIASADSQPVKMPVVDRRVVYIGETVDQTLYKRIYQFNCSLEGTPRHSGGTRLWGKGLHGQKLWLSIRSFPLGYGLDDEFLDSFRSSQIRWLERTLLYEYVHRNHDYPKGNWK